MTTATRQLLLHAALILILGAALGLTINHRLLRAALDGTPLPAKSAPAVAAAVSVYPQPVALAELRTLLAAGALAVDARGVELFAAGHIPGAVSLPLETVRSGEAKLPGRLPGGKTLIAYCSGYGCSDSFDLAVALIAAGYSEVRVFEGGLPEWQEANLPLEKGAP